VSLILKVSQLSSLAFYSLEVELAIEESIGYLGIAGLHDSTPNSCPIFLPPAQINIGMRLGLFLHCNMHHAFLRPSKILTPVKRTI
jgi:hypothetical protein